MFAALDDDDASTLYYSLAFIYALPYVASGFELDGFAIVSVLTCIFHVQASLGVRMRAGLPLSLSAPAHPQLGAHSILPVVCACMARCPCDLRYQRWAACHADQR